MSIATTAPQYRMPHGVIDTSRGTWAMGLFILTEAMLFLMLFFSYYYLGHAAPKWPPEPPKLRLPLIMLVLLVSSSVVLTFGERAARVHQFGRARLFVVATGMLGLMFLGLQAVEYADHLTHLRPSTNAYGSIFYTITSVHAVHVMLGLLMLGYVLVLPVQHMGAATRPPHHALKNAALYWHFVDVVWVLIVALLYVMPNLGR
jgi:heme/copper-type cytochrome/quinol oxidase subunit 3